jgi:hypothetical protein
LVLLPLLPAGSPPSRLLLWLLLLPGHLHAGLLLPPLLLLPLMRQLALHMPGTG